MIPQVSYHESVPVHRLERDLRDRRAHHQETLVLRWFRANPERGFSPEEIHAAVLPHAPLTSVRRAITNLTNRCALEKSGQTTLGHYRHRVNCWRLVRPAPVVQERLL